MTVWADGVGPRRGRGLHERLFDRAATAPEVPAFAGPDQRALEAVLAAFQP
ncbi:hypothetical protein [Nocardia sp. NPDC059239]|uniref:hypothetical protein n=1 Tax=unclassified Nocardia TaxID=2637762 RepID=UPI003680D517